MKQFLANARTAAPVGAAFRQTSDEASWSSGGVSWKHGSGSQNSLWDDALVEPKSNI